MIRREASLLDATRPALFEVADSAVDLRAVQDAFDEEAAAIELARHHVEQLALLDAIRRATGLRFGRAVVW